MSPTWSQTYVCLSQAGRKLVESHLRTVCDQVRTCLRPAFDPKKSLAGHELVADPHDLVETGTPGGNRVCDQVCDLDSVMEFVSNHAA